MDRNDSVITFLTVFTLVVGVGGLQSTAPPVTQSTVEESTGAYIVRGQDLEEVTRAIRSIDGRITHEVGIIGAVGAELTAAQARTLAESSGSRVTSDRPLGIDRNGRTERNG